jgi:hypothetical protein
MGAVCQALAPRWSDVRELSPKGGILAIDRVFVSGQIREATKTGRGRDVPIVPTLADDLLDLRATMGEAQTPPLATDWSCRPAPDLS